MKKVRKLWLSSWNWSIIMILVLFTSASGLLFATAETSVFQVLSSDQNRIVLDFCSPDPQFEQELLDGAVFSRITMPGAQESSIETYPDLPLFSTMLAIPINANYSVNYQTIASELLTAERPLPVISEQGRGSSLSSVYSGSQVYPERQVSPTGDAYLRDFRVLSLQTSPLSWDPLQRQYQLHRRIRITIELSYPDAPPADYTTYSYAFRNLYEAQIANFAQYRSLLQTPQSPRILMIHGQYDNEVFLSKLQDFARWKLQKGFEVSLVSTAQTGSSNVAIKSYIKEQFLCPATRPDYIILIGDVSGSFAVPTWFETGSGYNGEGDYPYTYLNGNDMLGDAFIGRISAENLAQLGTILNKIYAYEKNIDITSPASDWLDRMLIIGDPDASGISCVYVSQHIRELALDANPNYTFIENYSSGFATTMNQGLNQGVSFFTYRGIYGVSGWAPSSSLFNGTRLPHSVILTCDTGSFSHTALSENFIRLGTEASPAGAVTCIGMSTTGTHTAMNNALTSGIMNGIFTYKMPTMGEALLYSKHRLHALYGDTQLDRLRAFAHWCNLMGDPSLEAWVGIPKQLQITLPSAIPLGTRQLEIPVLDSANTPESEVSVTAYSPSENRILARAFTAATGVAVLELPSFTGTEILITAAKPGAKPVQQLLAVDQTGGINFGSMILLDDGSSGSAGNADGYANATETLALWVELSNSSPNATDPLTARLQTDNPLLQIIQPNSVFPAISAGSSGTNQAAFLLSIAAGFSAQERIRFNLELTAPDSSKHQVVFYLSVYNSDLAIASYYLTAGDDGIFNPGEIAQLSLLLVNNGLYRGWELRGSLRSLSSLVTVRDSVSYFGDILPGATLLSADGFEIEGHSSLIPGMQIPFNLRLFNDSGFAQETVLLLPVGLVSQDTPLGPDEYGYLIYDTTDTTFPDCPEYEWVEIAPSEGGPGTLVPDLYDASTIYEEGDTQFSKVLKILDLPFLFPFYGRYYDKITVCVNGFIALGETADGDFRNARLPGGQGPTPMIAAFWDDLYIPLDGGIYSFFDPVKRIYIIQYNKLKNGYDHSSVETFQVIFYDPLLYHTGLGDGKIKIQYKTFNNVDVGGEQGMTPLQGNYCTIGIKDHTNTRGLEYSFNNTNPQAAAPLGDGKAIMITTVPNIYQAAHLVVGELIVEDQSGDSLLEPGETARLGLKLLNLGSLPATSVSVTMSNNSAYASLDNAHSLYPDIPGSAVAVNFLPFEISISDSCPGGARILLTCTVETNGSSQQYSLSLEVNRPRITITGTYVNDGPADNDGILEPGETALLIVNLKNNTALPALNVSCTISGNPSQVGLIDSLVTIPYIAPYTSSQAVFAFTVPQNSYLGSSVNLAFSCFSPMIESQNVTVSHRIGSAGIFYDFENSNNSFTSNDSGGWAWGIPTGLTAHSGTRLWGIALGGNYANSATLTLITPPIYIGGKSFLEFWHQYQTETNVDGGMLQYFSSGSWITLTPVGGYPSYVEALGAPGFSGNSGWTSARFDLSSLAGRSIRFRWLFVSDAVNSGLGWYIDDFSIVGYDVMAGLISGRVDLIPETNPSGLIRVQNQDRISTCADSTGAYQLYLPVGQHSITALAAGFETITGNPVEIAPDAANIVQDFTLRAYKPVSAFHLMHSEFEIHLSWEAPQDPYFPVTGYRLMRKINASAFEPIELGDVLSYSERPETLGIYQYYVLVLYDLEQSTPSEILPVEYPWPLVPPPPQVTELYYNYPNPFNPTTTIGYSLAESGRSELSIFNLRGQLVRTLWKGEQPQGYYYFVWDGTDSNSRRVASGVYFYRLHTPNLTVTRKMLLLK